MKYACCRVDMFCIGSCWILGEVTSQKGRNLTQSYDKSPYTKEMSKGKVTTQTEDPRVNFEKRFAHYEIYTWTLCHSYLHEKQRSRIQSLNRLKTIYITIAKSSFTVLYNMIFDSCKRRCIMLRNNGSRAVTWIWYKTWFIRTSV